MSQRHFPAKNVMDEEERAIKLATTVKPFTIVMLGNVSTSSSNRV
jgi:hypothetical protein